jgi:CO/xanthine dehydrogenase FAD-binding subunit
MKTFNHIDAKTVAEASAALASGKGVLIAGGTDLLGRLKDDILPTYPDTVVNLKSIPNFSYIKEESGLLKIGAGTQLEDVATSAIVNKNYLALAQAAGRAASPHIRVMGTLGGSRHCEQTDQRCECGRRRDCGSRRCRAIAGECVQAPDCQDVGQARPARNSDGNLARRASGGKARPVRFFRVIARTRKVAIKKTIIF